MKTIHAIAALALAMATPLAAQEPAPTGAGAPQLSKQDVDAWLDGLVPYALASGDMAGAVVTVVADGAVVTNRGFGLADMTSGAPVDPASTLFRMGSISKLMTWTAVMQLAERGALDLDADVNTYLDFAIPAFAGEPVTLRQLLTHTAGFEEQLKFILAHDRADHLPFERLVREHVPDRIFAPSTTPAYSNYGTALAGYIVQRVSGMAYNDYVDAAIFAPLGMDTATFSQDLSAAQQAALAKGYATASGAESPFEWVAAAPAGAMTAAAPDMARFMLAHLNGGALDGERILAPETVQAMHAPAHQAIAGLNGMALGFYESSLNGRRVISHGGDTEVFHTDLNLFIEAGVGIFVALNSTGTDGAAHRLRALMLSQFADRYFPEAEAGPLEAIAENHAPEMAGQWTASRRSEGSFFALTDLLEPTVLATDDQGRLVGENLPIMGAAVRDWVEVEPYRWQASNSGERLGAVVENGQVTRFSLNTMAPITVYDRVPWQRAASWVTPALLASLGVLVLGAVQWPVAALVRRRYGGSLELTAPARAAYHGARGFGLLVVAVFAGWMVFLTSVFADLTLLSAQSDGVLMALQGLTIAGVLGLGASAAANGVLAVREGRGLWSLLWAVALVLATAVVIWVASFFNLLTFGVGY